jgi:pyruvate formate lyase activating enzyme
LLIPGENDSPAEIESMSRWIVDNLGADVPLHFSRFHPDWKMRDTPATPMGTLSRSRSIALEAGLQHVYTGNVHDFEGSSTYCASCGERLIGRDWYVLSDCCLTASGDCRHCGARLAGVFESRPGLH